MVSIGPFPIQLAVLLLALAIAVAVGWKTGRAPDPPVKVTPVLIDMLFVGLVAARIGFVLQWLPEYLADPWSIIRLGDGGFSLWAGTFAGLAFGAWQARRAKPLRRPLAMAAGAGLGSWALLAGALVLMQASALKLPTTDLAMLDRDTPVSLAAMSGQPMVVNLWATWCPPCRREMPVLAAAQERRPDVTFAFVNQGESEGDIRAYLDGDSLRLRNVLLDPFSATSQEAGARGLPATLFFDADGRLVDTHMGELSEATLTHALQRFGPAPTPQPVPDPSKETD
ncbi:thiol:disulfide interchange protein [Luteimonas terricola]|uniref:Thiol:disulfide interchange protein n=1 Tax=Luteimonas terricola TaxID=645597 RepID=A0ABQ2ED32_9GAMM|nr:TlpA disulfide reductase family protein [Luteimonas terricola]GGK05869.1 thiol:disulfide interchange protein [Luteimonas terricola]